MCCECRHDQNLQKLRQTNTLLARWRQRLLKQEARAVLLAISVGYFTSYRLVAIERLWFQGDRPYLKARNFLAQALSCLV